jgi:hypothetical protein
VWATGAILSSLGCAWAGAAAAGTEAEALRGAVFAHGAPDARTAPALADDGEPRFTVTTYLPGGRTEVRRLTAREVAALGATLPKNARPAPPPAEIAAAPAPRAPRPRTTAAAASPVAAPVRLAALPGVEPTHASGAAPLALAARWTAPDAAPDGDGDEAASAVSAPAASAPSAPAARRRVGKAVLGVRDGKGYREQGRFYVYAAGKGAGVGLNVVDKGQGAGWGGDGLSYDRGGFAGQRSAGIGWRKGDVSTSLGWVHEKVRVNLFGAPSEKDDRVALTLSWRPSVK